MRKITKILLIVSLVLSNILTVNVINADGANVATYSMVEDSAISSTTSYPLSGTDINWEYFTVGSHPYEDNLNEVKLEKYDSETSSYISVYCENDVPVTVDIDAQDETKFTVSPKQDFTSQIFNSIVIDYDDENNEIVDSVCIYLIDNKTVAKYRVSVTFGLPPQGGQQEDSQEPLEPQYTDYDSSQHKGEKIHVTTQAELEAALTKLAEAQGGVIYVDGVGEGDNRVLNITGDLPIYHKYPDNQNSQGVPNLAHSSYEDFLLIDLQCDIVTDGTIIINGYNGQPTSTNYKTYNANVLINGNGHSITSSDDLATLSTSYRAKITVANTKIVNTNEDEDTSAAAVLMAAGTFTADGKVELEGPIGLHVIPADMNDAGSQSSSINIEGKVVGTKNAAFVADGEDEYQRDNYQNPESPITEKRNAWFFGSIKSIETEVTNGYAAIIKGNNESQFNVRSSNNGICLANGRLNIDGVVSSNSDCIVIDKDNSLVGTTNTYVNIGNEATLISTNGSCIKELTKSESNIKQIKIVGGNFICGEEILSLSEGVSKETNNIEITGGKYNKCFAKKYLKANTEWEQQQDGTYLLKDNSGLLLEVNDLNDFKTAISNGNTNLKLMNSITLDGEIEIPYQINIDLNNKTITGGCLYFNARQIEGASLDEDSKSKLFNGSLVATTCPIVKTNGMLILNNAEVRNDTEYEEYLLSVIGDGSLDVRNCNIVGDKGIDLNVSRLFSRNSTELDISGTTIKTSNVAINAKGAIPTQGKEYPEFTIALSQGTQIVSDTTAIKSDTVKVLVSGATIIGKTCIDTNFAIDLDQKATLKSIKPQGDTNENAAIIINGPSQGRMAYYVDNESTLVSSDYDYAVILKGTIENFEVKHGNYSGSKGVIDISALTNGSDQISFDRGRLSHNINASYIPTGFECITVDNSKMPYAVVRKYSSETINNHTVQPYLLDELSNDVTIDSNALAYALGNNISGDATLIFSATEEDEEKVEQLTQKIGNAGDVVDCYDLHIDQKISDTEFNKLDTVSSLQTISIPLSNEAKNHKDNLVVYHEDKPMNLVTKEIGSSANYECAYIDNDILVIKTASFSSFSLVNEENNESPSSNNVYIAPKTGDR